MASASSSPDLLSDNLHDLPIMSVPDNQLWTQDGERSPTLASGGESLPTRRGHLCILGYMFDCLGCILLRVKIVRNWSFVAWCRDQRFVLLVAIGFGSNHEVVTLLPPTSYGFESSFFHSYCNFEPAEPRSKSSVIYLSVIFGSVIYAS